MLRMLFDIFFFILTHISLALFFPGSAEADIEVKYWSMISHLMASCAKIIRTKNH